MGAVHKTSTYKTVQIPHPFNEGREKAYGDILKDRINEARWWRLVVGIGALACFAVSLLLFYSSIRRQQTVPVLINVMPSGESHYLGEVRHSGAMSVPEAAILWQIRSFVSNLRSVSTDHQVVFNNIEDCYAMVTSEYSQVMTRSLRENSPFDLVGRLRRTVEIESVLRITERSYQADWVETIIDNSGRRTARMRGVITITLIPPTDRTIRRNPLGIYIENFEMTEL